MSTRIWLLISLFVSHGWLTLATATSIHEGFEGNSSIFTISSSNGCINFNENSTDNPHSGLRCLYVSNSCCPADCFQANRCDLYYYVSSPLELNAVSLWMLEGSSTGYAWGGKFGLEIDGELIQYWDCVGNNQPITGQWQYHEIPVERTVFSYIRIWEHDITNRTSMWIDDIEFHLDTTVDAQTTAQSFQLAPAYPNPFNPSTTLAFDLPDMGHVRLSIHDLGGREVARLVEGMTACGRHELVWNAAGQASGMYLAVLTSGGRVKSQRLLLIK
jgi:hypothetical protein